MLSSPGSVLQEKEGKGLPDVCTDLVGLCSCLQAAAQNTKSPNKHSCSPPAARLKLAEANLTEEV